MELFGLTDSLDDGTRWRRVDLNRSLHVLNPDAPTALAHLASQPRRDRGDGGAVRAPSQVPPLVQPVASQQEPSPQTSDRLACVPWETRTCANSTSPSNSGSTASCLAPSTVGEFHQGQFIFLAREAPKMLSRRGRFSRPDCEHLETVTIRNGGIQRTVCETCGHVSLKGLENLSGKASRRQFERASERASSMAG
jgi:hypothetical protein